MNKGIKTVLFVCVHNSGHSQMAEAFFNKLAGPKMLTINMVKAADRMITISCGAEAEAVCPASFIPTEYWALEDPKGKSLEQVSKIRDEIKERERKLVEEVISL